jgi:hypothetical protein
LEKALKLSSQSVTTGLALGLTTLLIACGAEESPHSTDANEASAAVSATAQTIQIAAKDVGNRAMEWQLARMGDFEDYIVKMRHTADPRNWVQAAFYIGLTQWVEARQRIRRQDWMPSSLFLRQISMSSVIVSFTLMTTQLAKPIFGSTRERVTRLSMAQPRRPSMRFWQSTRQSACR